MAATRKRRKKLSFHDRISRLTFHQACELLGDDAKALIFKGKDSWDIDPEEDVYLAGDLFRVRIWDHSLPSEKAVVVLTQMSDRHQTLHIKCDQCELPCLHAGGALGFLLEEKLFLGLSAPPDETVPLELLTVDELHERAIDERKQRAKEEKMTLRSTDAATPWTDYNLTSRASGKTYRVSLRGRDPGESFCSCPDFRTNHLGTCKHIMYALKQVGKRFTKKQLNKPYHREHLSLRVEYTDPHGLRFNMPTEPEPAVETIAGPFANETLTDATEAVKRLRKLANAGCDVQVYPDAEEWIERALMQQRLRDFTAEIRQDPENHPLRTSLLKTELLPYQMDGIAFAVGAGRAVLADDMGLGKTIQGIGTAELFAREVGIERVLVVCPASLKSQWRTEIARFSNRDSQLVLGRGDERAAQYREGAFFTICNYEQIMRDLQHVETVNWDLIILDEGQRIKNWESKTSQVIRSLRSQFALVLSGTPLENRLDELYTVVKFVDDQRLGPAYRFFHEHRIVNDTGRVQGYRQLDKLRQRLSPILLRRTRAGVMGELPERTTEVIRIPPTEEQYEIHTGHRQRVSQIAAKAYLTEMDLLMLQKSLLMCRMVADSTFLTEKEEPEYSSKLERLRDLLADLNEEPDRKIVLFSEWRRMLDRIELILQKIGMDYVRLDGQVPQKQRPALVSKFQEDPDCRLIMMTNAGSTGLNLQSANTVINVDLPWNPAVLEQRIARAHRMGQQNPVHVYILVTEETLEEQLLDTLAMKQDLALAALDPDSDVTEVEARSSIEEMKRKLEKLLGQKPDAPEDRTRLAQVEAETQHIAERRDKVASAGGQLVGAALQLVGELIETKDRKTPDPAVVDRLRNGLAESVERDEAGRPQLRITLDDDHALSDLANTLAKLLVTK